MIIESIFNVLYNFILVILNLFPELPLFPETLKNSMNAFLDLIFENTWFLDIFVPIDLIRIAVPVAVIIINLDLIISISFWIIKKLPFAIE